MTDLQTEENVRKRQWSCKDLWLVLVRQLDEQKSHGHVNLLP